MALIPYKLKLKIQKKILIRPSILRLSFNIPTLLNANFIVTQLFNITLFSVTLLTDFLCIKKFQLRPFPSASNFADFRNFPFERQQNQPSRLINSFASLISRLDLVDTNFYLKPVHAYFPTRTHQHDQFHLHDIKFYGVKKYAVNFSGFF